jgi:O-antigen ligase
VLPLALALVVWGLTGKLNHHSARPALIFSLPALGLLLAGLFASQSRSAWLGFAAAAVVILAVRSRRMVALLAVLVLLAALSGLAGAFQTAASQLDAGPAGQAYGIIAGRLVSALDIISIRDISTIEVTDANFATLERLAHWQAAREMWRDRPWLGVGFGNYEVIYPAYAPGRWLDPLGHAHNYLLNLGAETGLVGMIAYLIFWILIFRVTYLAVHYSAGFYQAVAAGGLGILTHLHVHNLFDNLYVQGMYLHMTVILALVSLVYRTFCLPDLVIAPSSPPVTGAANDLHTVSKAKSTSND